MADLRGSSQQQPKQQQQPQQQQPQQAPQLPVLDSVLEYEKLHRIGEGTYGVVYKARHIPTGQIVALKKVRFDGRKEGLPVTSVRELAILQQARHPNIVSLLKVVTGTRPDSVFLVFEYVEHDLGRVLDSHAPAFDHGRDSGSTGLTSSARAASAAAAATAVLSAHTAAPVAAFSEGEVKGLFRQLLSAVAYLHSNWILHRDLKLSNLLYSNSGTLKLCDFGLARHFHPNMGRVTPRVVTLWYRAPELLLGSDSYGPPIDAWALGCILGEFLRGRPLFPASTELEAVQMHCQLLGSPNTSIWPAMRRLPLASKVRWPEQPYNFLRRTFPELSGAGLSLLNGLLTYDEAKRMTAAEALNHPYFQERPYPRRPADMPTFPTGDTREAVLAHKAAANAAAAAAAAALLGKRGPLDDDDGYSRSAAAAAAAAAEELPVSLCERYARDDDDGAGASSMSLQDAAGQQRGLVMKRSRPSGGF